MKKVKALWAKVPAGFKKQTGHVVSVFVVTFVATAAPALPAVLGDINVGKSPSLSSIHAVVAASLAAAIRAAVPVARVAAIKLSFAVVKRVEAKPSVQAEIALAVETAVKQALAAQQTASGVRVVDGMVSR